MNPKKMLMVVVLVLFLGVVGVIAINVNNDSTQKIADKNTNKINGTASISNTTKQLKTTGVVKKSTERATVDEKNMLEITDNFFIEKTNDFFLNVNDYVGKSVKMEGLIYKFNDANGDICYAVTRNAPGCCGNDGVAGLYIKDSEEYPEVDTWVEITGVVETDTIYGTKVPIIKIASMIEKEKGKTFVTN